jgi:hypothetical protein
MDPDPGGPKNRDPTDLDPDPQHGFLPSSMFIEYIDSADTAMEEKRSVVFCLVPVLTTLLSRKYSFVKFEFNELLIF